MALIVEIRSARGTVTRHRLNAHELVIGRALSSDIVIEDPYVDAQHARIVHGENGFALVDLGSTNGVVAADGRREVHVDLRPGTRLRIGRTWLQFRDDNEPVAPTLVDSSGFAHRISTVASSKVGVGILIMLMLMAVSMLTALDNPNPSDTGKVIAAPMVILIFVLIWSALWTLPVHSDDRAHRFRGHLAIGTSFVLLVLTVNVVTEWADFLVPHHEIAFVARASVLFLLTVIGVVMQSAVVGVQIRRYRTGIASFAVVAVLAICSTMWRDRQGRFSDIPKFSGQLKPLSAALVPTTTVNGFVRAIGNARSSADREIDMDSTRVDPSSDR